jgi:hypothetical protein
MQIYDQIKRLINSKKYRNIQSNISLLKRRTGNAIFEVQNPKDVEKLVEVRRNSKESQEILAIYEHQYNEYQVLLNELGKKKKNLTTELFE